MHLRTKVNSYGFFQDTIFNYICKGVHIGIFFKVKYLKIRLMKLAPDFDNFQNLFWTQYLGMYLFVILQSIFEQKKLFFPIRKFPLIFVQFTLKSHWH